MDSGFGFGYSPDEGSISSMNQFPPLLRPFLCLLAAMCTILSHAGVLNPSGIVRGGLATFKISVQPASFPDSEIQWTATPANRVSFPFGNTGRTVQVRGVEEGDVILQAGIRGFCGELPQILARVIEPTEIPVRACIVGDGIHWAAQRAEVESKIADANFVFSQVGISFDLRSVSFTNRADWLHVERVGNQRPEIREIVEIMHGTGGLELYFVDEIEGAVAVHNLGGLVLGTNATGRTLSHEIGHTCGFLDVYRTHSGASSTVDGPVQRDWMPSDWSSPSEEGFYPSGLTQQDLLPRLLMYGLADESKIDIPYGDVYGLWYEWMHSTNGWSRQWYLSLAPVGFFTSGMNIPFSQ